MSSSALRTCPTCHQKWPKSDEHDLRGFAWLDPLPRQISVSNGDLFVHDGLHGPDRFLLLETKMPWEPPQQIQLGQNWLLRAVAKQVNWTVRLLHGPLSRIGLYPVDRDGVDVYRRLVVPASGVRASVADWLNGLPWRDPSGVPDNAIPAGRGSHTHGYSKVGDVWTCTQDFYAKGFAPETGCGDVWTPA